MSAALDTASDNVTPLVPRSGVPGARKAAIALMMLGSELAGEVMRGLTEGEVERLVRTAQTLRTIPENEATNTLEEYNNFFGGQTLLVPRADDFVRTVAEDTLGVDRIRALLGQDVPAEAPSALSDAVSAGPDAIANVLKKEHPQTVAVALSAMPPEKGSEVLARLPEEQRPEVIRRIAQVRSVTPALLKEIGDTLRRELESSMGGAMEIDGQNLVVSLLKAMPAEAEESIFRGLNESDPALSQEIRKKMFVFEDLVTLDSRGLQMMLKEIDGRTLTLSLKTASTAVREAILSSMSSRAATMILEDLEALGPVSVSQVESAQDEIVQVALRLASEGKINLR